MEWIEAYLHLHVHFKRIEVNMIYMHAYILWWAFRFSLSYIHSGINIMEIHIQAL